MPKFQIFTPEEIANLRIGGRILAECLKAVSARTKEGVMTKDLDELAETFIRDHGGLPAFKGYQGFPATLCTSVNDECVHGIPGSRVLGDGDIISIDCGVIFGGLYTDACVSLPIGNVSEGASRLLSTTAQALENALGVVKAGARIGVISQTVQQTVEAEGFHPVRALTGHGLGKHLHQFPDIPNVGERRSGPVIPVGTALAIEPIVSAGSDAIQEADDGWTIFVKDHALCAHFEHTVLVLADGIEVLTRLP